MSPEKPPNFGEYPVTHVLHHEIEASDGCKLAGGFWLPWIHDQPNPFQPKYTDILHKPTGNHQRTEHFPTILEFLPYRKDDWTAMRDHARHSLFCSHGFVVARFDLRGSGASGGLYHEEYEPQEQWDALQIIEWLAAQPWSNGNVGMYGKSWGGFNGLQVAFHQPKALKAIVSLYSTDDRFNTDIYYSGGCVLANGLPVWTNQMFLWNARPPPRLYFEDDDSWKAAWKERLVESGQSWMRTKLEHGRNDHHWKHASIGQRYDRIECACLVVGGLSDGYIDGAFRMSHKLNSKTRSIIGPWSHDWPDIATPGPNIAFVDVCLAWWRWFLKPDQRVQDGVENVEEWPKLQLFIRDAHAPAEQYNMFNGHWIACDHFAQTTSKFERFLLQPDSDVQDEQQHITILAVTNGKLQPRGSGSESNVESEIKRLKPSAWQGAYGGEWCAFSGSELAQNQHLADDAARSHAVCVDSDPLRESCCIAAQLVTFVTVNRVKHEDRAVTVRLSHVHDDHRSTLITIGHCNLGSVEEPAAVTDETVTYRVPLKCTTYNLPAGSIVRLSVVPQSFPLTFPSKGILKPLEVHLDRLRIVLQTLKFDGKSMTNLPPMQHYALANPPVVTDKQLLPENNENETEQAYQFRVIDDKNQEKSAADNSKVRYEVESCDPKWTAWNPTRTSWRERKQFQYSMTDDCSKARTFINSNLEMRCSTFNDVHRIGVQAISDLQANQTTFKGRDTLKVTLNDHVFHEKSWHYEVNRD